MGNWLHLLTPYYQYHRPSTLYDITIPTMHSLPPLLKAGSSTSMWSQDFCLQCHDASRRRNTQTRLRWAATVWGHISSRAARS